MQVRTSVELVQTPYGCDPAVRPLQADLAIPPIPSIWRSRPVDSGASGASGASVRRIVAAELSTQMARKALFPLFVYTTMHIQVYESEEVGSRTADQVAGSW